MVGLLPCKQCMAVRVRLKALWAGGTVATAAGCKPATLETP